MRLSSPRQLQRGSVVLVALCFLAVLGIALASYLAVSKQAVKLSNRSYQRSLSAQLAEGGIEQSLWSFGWNNWSAWDTTTIPGTAIRHINYSSAKYNNGVLGSIMLRVDRRDATVWNNFTAYSASTHDLVWHQGVWYQCTINVAPGTTPPSDSVNWISAPAPWNASANYQANNIVLYGDTVGVAYRCVSPNINTPPTSANMPTYWTTLGGTLANWDNGTNYAVDAVVLYGGMSYRCVIANSNKAPPNSNYWVGAPVVYAEGIAVPPDNPAGAITTQIRAFVAPAPLFPNAIAATSKVSLNATTGMVDSYNSPYGYPSSPAYSASIAGGNKMGTAVQMAGGTVQGYVSAPSIPSSPYAANLLLAGYVKGPTAGPAIDPTRISRSPYIPQFDISTWDANRCYRINDVVSYGMDYYVCIAQPLGYQNPSDTAYWKENEVLPLSGTDLLSDIELPSGPPYQNLQVYAIKTSIDLKHTITIKGSVLLTIVGDFQISAGKLIVAPTSYAKAVVQFSQRLIIRSTGTIDNQTLDPKKLLLIGSAFATSSGHMFNSPAKFYGTIYMPNATSALSFSNPGAGDPEVYGAVSAQKIVFNSSAHFHYDTSLRTATFPAIDTPFTVTEWRELTDPAEKIVFP